MGSPYLEMVKSAYDYAHESRQLDGQLQAFQHQEEKSPFLEAVEKGLVGAAVGAGLGYIAGHGRVPLDVKKTVGFGARLGGAMGLVGGAAGAMHHNSAVQESRRVVQMSAPEKADYLRSQARANEIEDQNRQDWDKAYYLSNRADLRRFYL